MTFGNIPLAKKTGLKELIEQREKYKGDGKPIDTTPVLPITSPVVLEEISTNIPEEHDTSFFKGYYHIISDESLLLQERVILCMITSLDHKENHCYATNQYFADRLKVTPSYVSRCVTKLLKLNRIESLGKAHNRRILKSLSHVKS